MLGDLTELGVAEAVHAVRAGLVSSAELVGACIDRIGATDERLRAWAHLDRETALEQAERMDALRRRGYTPVGPTVRDGAIVLGPLVQASDTEHVREWDCCSDQRRAPRSRAWARPHTRQRYKQWLTQELGSWPDRHGRSGCVGCGRCIAWRPAGIDITAEAAAICAADEDG